MNYTLEIYIIHMAPPTNSDQRMNKIAMDGFGLIEEFYGRANNGNKKGDPVFILTSKDGTPHCGGVSVVSYPKPKPPTRWFRFHF